MPLDPMHEWELVEYEDDGIEQMRKLEPESLWGDNDTLKRPVLPNIHPQRVKYTR